jgi:phage gp29-like protein
MAGNGGLFKERAPSFSSGVLASARYPIGSGGEPIVGYDELRRRWSVLRKIERDPVVSAALAFKKWLPVGDGWRVYSADDSPEAVKQAEFVRWCFAQMEGTVEELISNVLDAVAVGFSVVEKVYRIVDRGEYAGFLAPVRFVPKDPSTIGFELGASGQVEAITFTVPGRANAEPLPPEKFIHFVYEGKYRSPYGCGDLVKAYRSWWSKDNALRWWAMFVEKYGVVPRIGKYEDGASQEFQQELLDQLKVSAANTEFVVPKSVELELLQPDGDGQAFERFVTYHDKELAKAILGNTLLVDEGQRVGSMALGKVHLEVLRAQLRKLKRILEDRVMGEQIIRQIIDINYTATDRYPRFVLPDARKEELTELAKAIALMVDKGIVEPTEPWVRECLGFPKQEEYAS